MADEITEPEQEVPAEIPADERTDPAAGDSTEEAPDEAEQDQFPRSYVEKIRGESQRYRERAKQADELAHRLHTELVRATGKLADPTDLEFAEEHLTDAEALAAAVDDLLARKPHLGSRKPFGDIGQGATQSAGNVDLAAILGGRA